MKNSEEVNFYSVTISVNDIELTTKWYVDKIGFKKMTPEPVQMFNTKIQFLLLNNFKIELIENPNATKLKRFTPPHHTEIQGITNFCLQTKEICIVKEELQIREVEIIWESTSIDLGMTIFLIQDPEGNLIQFVQEKKN